MTIEMTQDSDGNLCQAITRLFADFLPVSYSPRSSKSWPFSRDYAGRWLMPLFFMMWVSAVKEVLAYIAVHFEITTKYINANKQFPASYIVSQKSLLLIVFLFFHHSLQRFCLQGSLHLMQNSLQCGRDFCKKRRSILVLSLFLDFFCQIFILHSSWVHKSQIMQF